MTTTTPHTPDQPSRRRRLGLWGLAIFALGHFALYVHVPHWAPLPVGLQMLSELVSLDVVAWGWLLTGLAMLWSAIRRQPGWVPAAGMFVMIGLWGTFYLLGVIRATAEGESGRSVIFAIIYLSVQMVMLSVTEKPRHGAQHAEPHTFLPRTLAVLDNDERSKGDGE